jgi:hypothetical protein
MCRFLPVFLAHSWHTDWHTKIQEGNRHPEGSFTHFKNFLKKDFLSPIDVTENLCQRFRKYLLDKFNGDTPANYSERAEPVVQI